MTSSWSHFTKGDDLNEKSSRPKCVVCGKLHDGTLLLCDACEQWAKDEKRKRGEPIR